MKKIKYYIDTKDNVLSAYDRGSDFFAFFNKSTKSWHISNISFIQFKHDRDFIEIDDCKAQRIFGESAVTSLFLDYLQTIESNSGIKSSKTN